MHYSQPKIEIWPLNMMLVTNSIFKVTNMIINKGKQETIIEEGLEKKLIKNQSIEGVKIVTATTTIIF